ncbi:MAG: nucleoside-diphosphate kinase [Nanoarchaeota archaeon]
MERTLVIIKPDGMKLGITPEVIRRFHSAGLRVSKIKKVLASSGLLSKHYPEEDEYLISIGKKNTSDADKEKAREIGLMVVRNLQNYLQESKVTVMIVEGRDGISVVRKIVGNTDPSKAEKGTIRGDFGKDSIQKANAEHRAVRNLIHASGNKEEAEKEIELWFGKI